METVYIASAARTPIGSFLGQFADLPAPALGSAAIGAVLERAGIGDASVLNEVIMGCVLPAGMGQAPARQAMRKAGVADSVGALTINKVCGSGMKAVMVAMAEILSGQADLIVAGGMESMSQAPYYLTDARKGYRMGHQKVLDAMIHDGLWDPYNDFHMGNAGELCVREYGLTREAQDAFAAESFRRARQAVADGSFVREIVPVAVPQKKGDPLLVATDEGPGKGDPEKLATLKPAFVKDGGTITAGNASTINDGASALLIASEAAVKRHGLKPMARIVGAATHSQDPAWFTTAPVGAVRKVLDNLKLDVADIDLFEVNEAFAVVAMVAMQDLGIPHEKLNVRGGAISLGHPIGSSGARIVVTLLHALADLNLKRGLATLCIGGGEATALVVERV